MGSCVLRMMLKSISPVDIIKARPHFGQVIVPKPGSVVASPVLAAYDPDPDYFFHWYRDSAVVMDALRLLRSDLPQAETLFHDHVRFSLDLASLDGRRVCRPIGAPQRSQRFRSLPAQGSRCGAWHGHSRRDARQSRWHLGCQRLAKAPERRPASRALMLLRWGGGGRCRDLAPVCLILRLCRAMRAGSSFDIWEEEFGLHAYTLRVSAAALEQGAAWLDARGHKADAGRCRTEAAVIESVLDDFWMEEQSHIRSRRVEGGAPGEAVWTAPSPSSLAPIIPG